MASRTTGDDDRPPLLSMRLAWPDDRPPRRDGRRFLDLYLRVGGKDLRLAESYLRQLAAQGWRGVENIPPECVVREPDEAPLTGQ